MRARLVAILAVAIGCVATSATSLAHHGSNVVYDLTATITVSGTVTRFQFVNPHALIFLEVTDENGETVEWLAGFAECQRLAG